MWPNLVIFQEKMILNYKVVKSMDTLYNTDDKKRISLAFMEFWKCYWRTSIRFE